ncbi:predicted protein [Nematostella vectensis]|uniref:Uncharacterized protein n=1 Tax=Nematostella vectensis TaxID=45351 RepID=A7RZL6_NEMVE|nr:predicted protein [Nematostella vectensis]|eukprot:XP_001635180.1 predicted protein [Nematostella vectensis]
MYFWSSKDNVANVSNVSKNVSYKKCPLDVPLTRIHWRASLVPAAAVIPAPIAYIKVVAVKKKEQSQEEDNAVT